MKKLYRKGTVHPSPPIISDHLAFLPATILTLAAALSPEDREVLAYLISCSSSNTTNINDNNNHNYNDDLYSKTNTKSPRRSTSHHHQHKTTSFNGTDHHHAPLFNCNCFGCYMSYWVRWDSSPNRQLIHEIIDAFEDGLLKNKKMKSKKERRKTRGGGGNSNNGKASGELKPSELGLGKGESGSVESSPAGGSGGGDSESCGDDDVEEKGSVRRFMSFVGERIWAGVLGVWN